MRGSASDACVVASRCFWCFAVVLVARVRFFALCCCFSCRREWVGGGVGRVEGTWLVVEGWRPRETRPSIVATSACMRSSAGTNRSVASYSVRNAVCARTHSVQVCAVAVRIGMGQLSVYCVPALHRTWAAVSAPVTFTGAKPVERLMGWWRKSPGVAIYVKVRGV